MTRGVAFLAAVVFAWPPPAAAQTVEWRVGASLIPAIEESIRLLPGAEVGFVRWNLKSARGLGFHSAIYQRVWPGAPGWGTIIGWRNFSITQRRRRRLSPAVSLEFSLGATVLQRLLAGSRINNTHHFGPLAELFIVDDRPDGPDLMLGVSQFLPLAPYVAYIPPRVVVLAAFR